MSPRRIRSASRFETRTRIGSGSALSHSTGRTWGRRTPTPVGTSKTAISSDAGYTYAGGWITASNPADLGGGVHFSTAAGATATYSDNRAFAWITRTGPTHGSARVYIDGVLVKTVSTYSAVVHRRRVVFARYWNVFFGPPHTITIMNIATSGHPRVDVDGVAIMSEG